MSRPCLLEFFHLLLAVLHRSYRRHLFSHSLGDGRFYECTVSTGSRKLICFLRKPLSTEEAIVVRRLSTQPLNSHSPAQRNRS